MKKLILVLTLIPGFLKSQWVEQINVATIPYELQMIDSTNGFLSSFDGLYETNNGWKNSTFCSSNETVNSFQVISSQVLLKCGLNRTTLRTDYASTINGCNSWVHNIGNHSVSYYAVRSRGDTIITNIDPKNLIISHNKGLSWDTILVSDSINLISSIHFQMNKTLLVTTIIIGRPLRQIFISEDNGKTWSHVSSKAFEGISELHVPVSGKGVWAVGADGLIIRSDDLGKSWNKLSSPSDAALVGVQFLNDSLGFVCGGNSVTQDSGRVYRTRDGGKTWNHITPKTNSFITDVFFVNDSVGFVTAHDGSIYKTTNAGGAATPDTLFQNPTDTTFVASEKFRTNQINLYPNPSKGTLNITWSYETPENAELFLIDVHGRVLHQSTMLASQSLQLELQHLSTGLYFVSLATPEGREVLRWVKE